MLQRVKKSMSSFWAILALAFGTVLVFLRMKGKYDTALGNAKLSDALIADAKEEAKSEARQERITKVRGSAVSAKKKARTRTPKEVEATYNGRTKAKK